MESPVLDAIYTRRSIREFTPEPVETDQLKEIINAGIWAPSGLNNQPWRFVIIQNKIIQNTLAGLTHYSHIVTAAPALIAVYLDVAAMYDDVKDHQATGSCIQNMLLAAHGLGLEACWVGAFDEEKLTSIVTPLAANACILSSANSSQNVSHRYSGRGVS